MQRLKSRGIVVLAVLGLFAFSGIAMADTEDDTVFNYGADDEFFFWNVTSLEFDDEQSLEDLSEECSLNDETEYEYSIEADGSITLTDANSGDPVELGDCGELLGGDVTGPEGEVNHGMYLKLFNELYEGEGNRGCLVRHIAQSDLGMPDQGDEEPAEEPDSDTVTFTTVETNCINGNPFAGTDEEGAEGETEGETGAPAWVSELKGGENGPANPAAAGEGRP